MEEKRCTKCGEVKLVSEFYKDTSRRDGLRERCKACRRADSKAYYTAHSVECIARGKAWRKAHPERARVLMRAWHAANTEKNRAYQKEWRDANRKHIRVRHKNWRDTNQEQCRATGKAWRDAHPERLRAVRANRRARENGAAGQASIEQMTARWDYYGGLCYICGMPAEATDHVIPLAKGGSNWPANLRPICKRCNSVKGAKWPYDFEQLTEKRYNAGQPG